MHVCICHLLHLVMPSAPTRFRLWMSVYASRMDLQYDGRCRISLILDSIVMESLIVAADVILTVRGELCSILIHVLHP